MQDIRVAAVVCRCRAGEPQKNLEDMGRWIQAAKAQGAALICFPEMNISGYDPNGRSLQHPLKVPDDTTARLVRMSDENGVVVLAGSLEADDRGKLFASHLVMRPGQPLQVYRKLHLSPPEQNRFSAGNHLPVFDAAGVRFGIQLCYDAHFPELSAQMALRGAEILFIPHASPRKSPQEKFQSWHRHLPARAFDNSLFVVACNQTGDNGAGLQFPGVAMALDPTGAVLRRYTGDREMLLVVDLKAEVLRQVRSHPMRYFLPQRREDLAELGFE